MYVCMFVCLYVPYAFQHRLTNLYETWQDASSWPWAGFRPETEVLPEVEPEKPEVPFFRFKSRFTRLIGFLRFTQKR